MNFLAPAAFAFAAAIPVVILFYLLKRKRVVKLVSSTLLWQRFLSETQASAPFQKLRKNWLLILQIILLIIAVLALTRPFFAARPRPSNGWTALPTTIRWSSSRPAPPPKPNSTPPAKKSLCAALCKAASALTL